MAPGKVPRMPVLFVGHGSPMNGIEDNGYGRAWEKAGNEIPRPSAILCISAHWETDGPRVTANERPKTIHDFQGFPDELYAQEYPAPGSPGLARQVASLTGARPDRGWGLDHGTWVVLKRMFPEADIPVVQLALDRRRTPAEHYQLGGRLAPLRDGGVLVLGSGNIVHNLMLADFSSGPYDWAVEFDDTVRGLVESADHEKLVQYDKLGKAAELSIPTNEHYLPMLYALALAGKGEAPSFFNAEVTYGSLSMRSFALGL